MRVGQIRGQMRRRPPFPHRLVMAFHFGKAEGKQAVSKRIVRVLRDLPPGFLRRHLKPSLLKQKMRPTE